jgi:hypothetical protein
VPSIVAFSSKASTAAWARQQLRWRMPGARLPPAGPDQHPHQSQVFLYLRRFRTASAASNAALFCSRPERADLGNLSCFVRRSPPGVLCQPVTSGSPQPIQRQLGCQCLVERARASCWRTVKPVVTPGQPSGFTIFHQDLCDVAWGERTGQMNLPAATACNQKIWLEWMLLRRSVEGCKRSRYMPPLSA